VIVKWLFVYLFKLNDEKCYLMVLRIKAQKEFPTESSKLRIATTKITESSFRQVINFQNAFWNLCRKMNRKIHALASLPTYVHPTKSEILVNYVISSQFNCCIPIKIKVVPYALARRGVTVREDIYPESSACEVGWPVPFFSTFIFPVLPTRYLFAVGWTVSEISVKASSQTRTVDLPQRRHEC